MAPATGTCAGRALSFVAMATRAVSAPLAQIPNALTIFRFALIPVFIVFVLTSDGGHSWPAAIVFAVAGITDQVDGWLARRWHVESEFGKVADPLADRLPWAALLILARDIALIGGYKIVVHRGYDFSVSFLGKLATWILYASIGFVLVTHEGTAWPLVIFWIGFALAVAAAALYLVSALRHTRRTA